METNKIDSFFRKSINESEDYYAVEANVAKERIWDQVQSEKKQKGIPLFFRLLAAACILLFISTAVLFVTNLKTQKKINSLIELNTELNVKIAENDKGISIKNESPTAVSIISPDTVFIEKKVVVTNTVVQKEQVIDTVYIQQIVYVEKEFSPEPILAIENSLLVDSAAQTIAENYETEILISKPEAAIKEKRKKIKLKFGGNQNPGNDGKIALSSKF
jgi:hypothetical protein